MKSDIDIEKLRIYIKSMRESVYTLDGHPLEGNREEIKKAYLKLLNSIISYKQELKEVQLDYLKSIKKACKVEMTLEEVQKGKIIALGDCEDPFMTQLIHTIRSSHLKYNLILECLLILLIGINTNDEQLELLSEFCEGLDIDEDKFNFLGDMALAILQQESEAYMRLIERLPRSFRSEQFTCYVRSFLVGRLIDDEEHVIYYSSSNQKGDFNKVFKNEEMSLARYSFLQDVIVFENWNIDLSDFQWSFKNNRQVKFINCTFTGKGKCIYFDGVNNIIIEACIFKGFQNRVLVVNDCNLLSIKTSRFLECVYVYDVYQNSNGAIYYIEDKAFTEGEVERKVEILNCTFKECGTWNKEDHYYTEYNLGYSGIIAQHIIDSNFYNCLSYSGKSKRITKEGVTLFNRCIGENCKITASYPLT